jgi:diguanylate cyclase (GGDEF)-like protein/PAS domain S-box-containing protein
VSWVDRTRRGRRQGRSGPSRSEESETAEPPVEVPELTFDAPDPPPVHGGGLANGSGFASGNGNGFANGNGNGLANGHGNGLVNGHPGAVGDRPNPDGFDEDVDAVLGLDDPYGHGDDGRQLGLPLGLGPSFRAGPSHEADVVAVVSATGRLVFVSASAERLLGFDVSDAVGLDALRLFDPASEPAVQALFADLVARRRLSVSLELRCRRSDGRELDLELQAANHLDDPVGGIVVTLRDITERKRLESRVSEVDRRQNALIESLADGVVMVDADGVVVRVNEAFEVMFFSPRIRTLGHPFEALLGSARDYRVELFDESGAVLPIEDHPVLVALRRGRRVRASVVGYRRGDAPARWVRVGAQAIVAPDGRMTGVVGTFTDVTDVKRSAYALRQEEEFLRVLLDTLDEGIVACDAQGRMTIFNPAARRLHGLGDDVEPIGRIPSSRMLRHADGSPMEPDENPLLRAMSGERLRNAEIVLAPPDGELRKVSVNGQALVDEDGWKLGAVVAMHDVTEQKRNEERLADLAHHDPLTGLANRTLLAIRMGEAVDALRDHGSAPVGQRTPDPGDTDRVVPEHPGVAVYLLDLDNFKEVNDDFGHDVGDDLLVAVARRLLAIVRPTDTVARLGGDEFVVVCGIESGEEEMLAISHRISSALSRPYRIDGRTLVAEASVGGVFVDDPDTDPSKLLSLADDAMYGVKWSRRRHRRPMTD